MKTLFLNCCLVSITLGSAWTVKSYSAERLKEYPGAINGAQCTFFLSWATSETVVGYLRSEVDPNNVITISGTQPNEDELLIIATRGVTPVSKMMLTRVDDGEMEKWEGEMKPEGENQIIPVVFARSKAAVDEPEDEMPSHPSVLDYDKTQLDVFLVRFIDSREIEHWSYAQIRYTINYIYARNGYAFKGTGGPIRAVFDGMDWYRPSEGLSMEAIDQRMNEFEVSNIKVLAALRARKQ